MNLILDPSVNWHITHRQKTSQGVQFEQEDVKFEYRSSATMYRIADSFAFSFNNGDTGVFLPARAVVGMYELLEMMLEYSDDRTMRRREMWQRFDNGESLNEIAADFSIKPDTVRENIKTYKSTWQYHVEKRKNKGSDNG